MRNSPIVVSFLVIIAILWMNLNLWKSQKDINEAVLSNIECLKMGMVYVGDDWCMKAPWGEGDTYYSPIVK